MKKFIVKFATVILYVLMVAYLSGFKIGLLLDWKALAAVFSGSLLFSVPAVFNTYSGIYCNVFVFICPLKPAERL